MTAGCLASPPIMRPCHCRTILQAYIYALLLLISKAEGEDSGCEDAILVRRHMLHNVSLGEHLKIECPVEFCQNSTQTISWFKLEENIHTNTSIRSNSNMRSNSNSSMRSISNSNIRSISSGGHINIEFNRSSPLEGTSFLVFENILRNDSGFYQCQSGDIVSFKIGVFVSDGERFNKTGTTTPSPKGEKTDPFLYIYTSAGIVAFVVLVIIISVASMLGCKGKSKKKAQTNDQYIAIPMKEQPLARVSHQVSPRGSPSVPPSRRSSRRKMPTSTQVNELPPPPAPPRDDEPCYSEIKKDRGRPRKTVAEEKNSIIYAALNHQPLEGTAAAAAAAARPRRTIEESSEYAAIRVS